MEWLEKYDSLYTKGYFANISETCNEKGSQKDTLQTSHNLKNGWRSITLPIDFGLM